MLGSIHSKHSLSNICIIWVLQWAFSSFSTLLFQRKQVCCCWLVSAVLLDLCYSLFSSKPLCFILFLFSFGSFCKEWPNSAIILPGSYLSIYCHQCLWEKALCLWDSLSFPIKLQGENQRKLFSMGSDFLGLEQKLNMESSLGLWLSRHLLCTTIKYFPSNNSWGGRSQVQSLYPKYCVVYTSIHTRTHAHQTGH